MKWRHRAREWSIRWLGEPGRYSGRDLSLRYDYMVLRCEHAEQERDYLRGAVTKQHETIEKIAESCQQMSKEMIRLAQLRNPAHEAGEIEDPPTRDQADRMAAIALRDKAIPPVPGLERGFDAD